MPGLDVLTAAMASFLQDVEAAITQYQAQPDPDLTALATQLESLLDRGKHILDAISTINSGLGQL